MKLFLNDLGMVCAVGNSRQEIMTRILAGDTSGLTETAVLGVPTTIGQCQALLPEISRNLIHYDCRNNRLLLAALSQIKATVDKMSAKFGVNRIGVVLGTSTSGVRNTEEALAYQAKYATLPEHFHYKQQQMGAGADFLAAYLGLTGPAFTISTACSASGKAFASARRLIKLDLCDAVIVGGADTLCDLTIHGFAALESLSTGRCKPFGLHRDGISIGEAASLFVLSKESAEVQLSGIGASSDAYHFSAPDPSGTAVVKAMKTALTDADKHPENIDYINLHGTATVLNDAMESKAVNALYGYTIPCSSTKGMTGHTLGTATALELGVCWMLLAENRQALLPPNINGDEPDKTLPPLHLVEKGESLNRGVNVCQSNSFAFGGNNISIIIEKS